MTLPPIRREVLVGASPAVAFELFAGEIGRWWPLGRLSVFGEGTTVAFEDGRIIERAPDGRTNCWGEVTSWQPPEVLAFTWHPGDRPAPSAVTVHFEPRDGGTLVVLEHSGWESFADPTQARSEYGEGWPTVLSRYADHVAAAVEAGAGSTTWVALEHRPGPAAPAEGSIFEHPLFAQHLAFLHRMRDKGYLVAAGPLGDRIGEGMTVLCLPGIDGLAEATRLATQDDASVAEGLFTVTVRPWQVVLTAG